MAYVISDPLVQSFSIYIMYKIKPLLLNKDINKLPPLPAAIPAVCEMSLSHKLVPPSLLQLSQDPCYH